MSGRVHRLEMGMTAALLDMRKHKSIGFMGKDNRFSPFRIYEGELQTFRSGVWEKCDEGMRHLFISGKALYISDVSMEKELFKGIDK